MVGEFTYLGVPTVTGISPAFGPVAGGVTVTITGTNLANATAVKFGTVPATIKRFRQTKSSSPIRRASVAWSM